MRFTRSLPGGDRRVDNAQNEGFWEWQMEQGCEVAHVADIGLQRSWEGIRKKKWVILRCSHNLDREMMTRHGHLLILEMFQKETGNLRGASWKLTAFAMHPTQPGDEKSDRALVIWSRW